MQGEGGGSSTETHPGSRGPGVAGNDLLTPNTLVRPENALKLAPLCVPTPARVCLHMAGGRAQWGGCCLGSGRSVLGLERSVPQREKRLPAQVRVGRMPRRRAMKGASLVQTRTPSFVFPRPPQRILRPLAGSTVPSRPRNPEHLRHRQRATLAQRAFG